jgi:hypothetical protein
MFVSLFFMSLPLSCYTRFLYSDFRLSAVLFQCRIHGQNFKIHFQPLNFSSLSLERDSGDKLGMKGFWRQFNVRTVVLYISVAVNI